MRSIEERTGHAREESLRTGDVGVPGHAHAVGDGCLWRRLVGIHRIVFEVADSHALLERDRKVLLRGICGPVGELRKVVVGDCRHDAFPKVVVAGVDAACIDAEVQGMLPACPGQVVVDLPLRHLATLWESIVQAADCSEGNAVTVRCQHDRKCLLHLRVVVRLEDAGVPACSGIELIDEVWTEQMRVPRDQRALRLRRKGVEDGVYRISPFCLEARVLLEAIPDAVFGVDRVVDL